MQLYVVTYDIPCDKRRKKVAELLEGYGQRVQLSVFECCLEKQKYEALKKRLQKLVKLDEDSVRFYPLSAHSLSQVEIWGGVPLSQPPGSTII
ncbi:CRISPR-associated endonuclease Cas2 (plasmid) [Euhalothece natronophila Z-M001]|uniref:CRISPR-associated endoribonuclease Cas2 n=1 Tax=Euhalothece natronophila Z-M001 TaxID=522448 RepID=A0A5B8NRC5_9CHRO|nr:CRISPR-associated endonuclease Cas2 [Euhalothece natronophila]QDZ41596.1 CRISPR-associated endonuclease Cas2 [Euhalothece natronophila Z-M001]